MLKAISALFSSSIFLKAASTSEQNTAIYFSLTDDFSDIGYICTMRDRACDFFVYVLCHGLLEGDEGCRDGLSWIR